MGRAEAPGVHAIAVHHRSGRLEPHASRSHSSHVLGYIVTGELRLQYGAVTSATAGCMGVMPAGVPHEALGGRGEWWFAEFCAPCHQLDEMQALMRPFDRVRRGATPIVPIAASRRRRVVRLFRDLQEECERREPESLDLARSLLNLLLGEACRAAPRVDPPAPNGLVIDALQFIQRRALEPISLRDVARAVHRSPAHVAAVVKDATGHTVGDWIRAARVAEAASLLEHSNASLDAIAERVGWRDKTHFIRQFRKVQGQTPAAWRRAHRLGAAGDGTNDHGD
ncbi:MAG: AraC family transcriptional regulator [Myxococcota bacterium]